MVIDMAKKIKTMCCIGLALSFIFTSVSSAAPNRQVSTQLFKLLETNDISVQYTTLMLLSHTTLTNKVYDDLIQFVSKQKDPVIRLTACYVLAKRTQETKLIQLFVDSYPHGEPQKEILNYHWKHSQYLSDVTVSSPLQTYLADLSSTNDVALEKLVSGYHTSGSMDELGTQIAELYKQNPNRIRPLLKKFKVDETAVKKMLEKHK